MKNRVNGVCPVCGKAIQVFGFQCLRCRHGHGRDYLSSRSSQEEMLDLVVIRPVMFIR